MSSVARPSASVAEVFSLLSLFWAANWSGISRYRFRVDDIDHNELVSIGRPGDPWASWAIVPTPDGVLMSSESDGWTQEVAFRSLRSALLAIHPLSGADLRIADRQAVSDSAIVPELH